MRSVKETGKVGLWSPAALTRARVSYGVPYTSHTQSCEEPCSCHQFTDDGPGGGSGLLKTPVSGELRLETLSVC